MTSNQLADSSRFGATLAVASDAKAHRATFVAAIERLSAQRHETVINYDRAAVAAFCA